MYSFFVLGQVPGTDIIITFTMWAQLAAFTVACLAWLYVRRSRAERTSQFTPTLEPTISAS